jgi:ribose-phosphate pyrophosphokinase
VSGSEVVTDTLIGNVKNKTVLMFDDMISTAGTVCEAARFVMDQGATEVLVAATHPVLVGPAIDRLIASPISEIIVTNTIPLSDRAKRLEGKLVELCLGELLGNAIHNIHHDQSVSALLRNAAGAKR